MNKTKFFSSLLVAVLFATTSVFVSCKDYDDDIKNLQSQIDKAALKADLDALSTKLAGAETTANAAKTTAENALAKANANATEIAAVKATAEKAAADAAKALTDVAKAQSTADAAQKAAEAAQKTADEAKALGEAAATKKELADAVAKLQKAVDDLAAVAATKKELADAQTELKAYTDAAKEAAIATAKAAAEKALTDAKGYTDAEVAKINESLKTLATQAAVEKLSKDLGDEITGLKNTLAAITDEEKMAELVRVVGSFDTVVNTLFSAVTSVELISSYYDYIGNSISFDQQNLAVKPFSLDMTTGTIAENSIFGDEHSTFRGETYEFVKGANIDFNDGVIVRVSPVTADLTAANILLVNSKGEGLDDYVVPGTPVRLEEMGALITRGTKIQSGLWFVPFSIKADVTEKEFAAATQVKVQQETSNILYAVAVNNTAESDANRYAVSTYDVDPDYAVYTPDTTFAFTVDKKPVAQIRNRWNGSKAVSEETGETSTNYGMDAKELMWKTPSDKVNTPATEPGEYNEGKNLIRLATEEDNEVRYQMAMVPVEVGKPFTIKMSDYLYQIPNTQQYETVAPEKKIQYYYVTLDERVFSVESDPSEWNAWNAYYPNIENLNKLIPAGQSVDITINDAKANGDIIGFRVYAVNYDGTLADPDGRAFYVQVGDPGTSADAVATYYATKADYDFVAAADGGALKAEENKSNTAGNAKFTAEYKDKTYTGTELGIYFGDEEQVEKFDAAAKGTGVVTIDKDDFDKSLAADLTVQYTLLKKDGKAATKWSEVAGVAIAVKNPGAQVDGSTVSFTLTAKDNSSDRIINSLTVGVKKELPTAEFAIEWRATLEPVDGVLTVYPSPSDATHSVASNAGVQTITPGAGAVNPTNAGAIVWPVATGNGSLSGNAVKSAIVDLGGYANGLKKDTFDWIVKKIEKKGNTEKQYDVTIPGTIDANNPNDFDHYIIDIEKKYIGQSFDSEIKAVYEDVSLAKIDGEVSDYTITAWTGKIKFASVFQDLVEYGNAAYDCWPYTDDGNDPATYISGHKQGNTNNFMRNDYYYFYAATEVGNIWQKLDMTTADGDGTNNNKFKTLSNLDLKYWALTGTAANTAAAVQGDEDAYKLNALFSADWKGANAQEKLTSRMKAQNAGLVPEGSLLDYVTFTKETEVPGGAKTLIKAEATPEDAPTYLKITNLPGGTCTSPVEDKINIKATDQFGANKFTMGLNLTIKPSTAQFNYENGL